MNFQPYREGIYIVDLKNITAFYPKGQWSIGSENIDFFSERVYQNCGQYIYEISVKARGWDKPYPIGSFVCGQSGMRDHIMSFAASNNIAYHASPNPSSPYVSRSVQGTYGPYSQPPGNKNKSRLKRGGIAIGAVLVLLVAAAAFYWVDAMKYLEWDASKPVIINEIFTGGKSQTVTEKIAPSDKPYTAGKSIKVTFPAGAISMESDIVIKKADKPVYLKGTDTVLTLCDIKLLSGEGLAGNVRIEIPYEKSALKSSSTEKSVGALYYNENTKEWEAVPCSIDKEKGTITLYTDHFSTYAAAVSSAYDTPGKGKVPIDAEAPLLTGNIPPIAYDSNVLSSIITNIPKAPSENNLTFMKKGWEIFNTTYSFGTVGTGLLEDTLDVKYFEKFNAVALELGGIMALGQVSYDLYQGDNRAAIKDGVPASIYYSIGKMGTKGMKIASAGVFFIDYSLAKMGEAALEGRYENYKKAYRKYYQEEKSSQQNVNYWSKFMYEAIQASTSPEEADKKIRAKIDDYAMEFWRDTMRANFIFDEQGHAQGGDVNLTDEEISRIAGSFKAELWNGIMKEAVEIVRERIYMDAKKDAQNSLMKYRKEMSRKHNIIVTIENASLIDDIEKVQMRLTDSQGNKIYAKNFGVTGTCKFEATCYGLQQNGFPNTIEMYVPAGKNHGETVEKINFKLREGDTYISLNVRLAKAGDSSSGQSKFTGNWKLTDVEITDVLASDKYWQDKMFSSGRSLDEVKKRWKEDYLRYDVYFLKANGEISVGIPSFKVPPADAGKYYIQFNLEQQIKDKDGKSYYRTATLKTNDVQEGRIKVISKGYILAGYTLYGEYHYDEMEMNMELKDNNTITGTAVRKTPTSVKGVEETLTIKYRYVYKRLSSKPSLKPEIR